MHNNTYHFKLSPENYKRIVKGKKKIELRLNNFKKAQLKYGDIIEFAKLPEIERRMKVRVIGIHRFKTFKEVFSMYSLEDFGYPKGCPVEKFVLDKYKYYSPEKERKYGVIAIEFEEV